MELVEPTNNILNQKAEAVTSFNSAELKVLVDEMLELSGATQKYKGGKRTMVGLAAPQIGISKRVIIVDLAVDGIKKPTSNNFLVAVNPRIFKRSNQRTRGREGCFSTGRVCGAVSRPNAVEVEYYDQSGHKYSREFKGFTARIFQHEIDHLDGKRFPDRIRSDKYLHWVEEDEFEDYRNNWQTWTKLCSRDKWKKIKTS